MTNPILGLDAIAMTLIIATSGTILYHIRNLPQGNFNVRKIVDARLAIFGSAVTAAIITLGQIPADATQELQLAIVLGEIGAISGFSFVAKHMNTLRISHKHEKERAKKEILPTLERADGEIFRDAPIPEPTEIQTAERKEAKKITVYQDIPAAKGGGWYRTNFVKHDQRGNVLEYGTKDLIVEIPDATYISAGLKQKSRKSKTWNLIQLEHTERASNPWNNKVKFEMLKRNSSGAIESLPRGEYQIMIECHRPGKGYTTGITDNFDIV